MRCFCPCHERPAIYPTSERHPCPSCGHIHDQGVMVGEGRNAHWEHVPVDTRDRGLYPKYRVQRTDGRDRPGGDRERARYFVLDYIHDPYAALALRLYARLCAPTYGPLAADLDAELDGLGRPGLSAILDELARAMPLSSDPEKRTNSDAPAPEETATGS